MIPDVVALEIDAFQVIQQPPPLPHQLQQTATRMMILGVGLEVFGQIPDAVTQQCDLHLGRTGIGVVPSVRGQDALGAQCRAARSFSHVVSRQARSSTMGFSGCKVCAVFLGVRIED